MSLAMPGHGSRGSLHRNSVEAAEQGGWGAKGGGGNRGGGHGGGLWAKWGQWEVKVEKVPRG